jgi:hypothetical protein
MSAFFAKTQDMLKEAVNYSRLSLEEMHEESRAPYGGDIYSSEDFAYSEETLKEAVWLENTFQKVAPGLVHLLRLALNSEDETLKAVAKQIRRILDGEEAPEFLADSQNDALKTLGWLVDDLGDPSSPSRPSHEDDGPSPR